MSGGQYGVLFDEKSGLCPSMPVVLSVVLSVGLSNYKHLEQYAGLSIGVHINLISGPWREATLPQAQSVLQPIEL